MQSLPDALPHVFLVAVAALLFTATPADTIRAKASVDSLQAESPDPQGLTDRKPIRVRPVIPLSALYSGTFSVGLGAGVGIENVGWEGSDITATAFGALRGYGAGITLATGDPYGKPLYGLLHGEVSRATRRRFFGAGPLTAVDDLVEFDHTSATLDARVGGYPLLTTALIVQPSARLLIDRIDTLTPEAETALRQLDAPSQAAAVPLVDETRIGVSLGLELASDRLDWHDYPTRGTYASVEARRFIALDDSDLRFTRFASSISGYLPVTRQVVLMGHASSTITRQADEAVIPFVYLPTLDNDLLLAYASDRFRGRDVLALGLGLRAPVVSLYGIYGLDAEVTGTVGNAYPDVFDEFDPSVSFEAPLPRDGEAPLRPALSLALNFVNYESQTRYIGGRIGVSPEGLNLAVVSITADLRDVVPLFR